MKRILLETSFSKIYMIVMIIITLLILGGYFSYAMFTVTKEKSNAISIVTGNLYYKLEVDGKESDTITVEKGMTKEVVITLSNPNNRIARFNFYYIGNLPSNVEIGYIKEAGINIPPVETGINLEKIDTAGSSNKYKIKVINASNNNITINLGVSVGLDYNDLTIPSDGYLFEEIKYPTVAEVVLKDQGENGSAYDDGVDTFIIGTDPNNYIWYSGKLWRAVSVNNDTKTTKLVTQWNISTVAYNIDTNAMFKDSHMEMWLNDTTVDGFLGNLREPEKFIVMDAKWDATIDNKELGSINRPNGTATVTDAVGLINMYEYQTSYRGTSFQNGYLNNGLQWYTLTPYNSSNMRMISNSGDEGAHYSPIYPYGVRPSINLKFNIKIVGGNGTVDDPYRLEGDNDTVVSGTLLNTRYSGEYLTFGMGENNLYRIVSHETEGLTKIVSAGPLKDYGTFKSSAFGNNATFSSTNTIGTFLNGEYLKNYVGNMYDNMIEDNTIWYLGTVADGQNYRLAKYKDVNMSSLTSNTTTAKVGLLRLGELMSGYFERFSVKGGSDITGLTTDYWTLTPTSTTEVRYVYRSGHALGKDPSTSLGIKPSLNLKSNVIITGGDGTKENPFQIELAE